MFLPYKSITSNDSGFDRLEQAKIPEMGILCLFPFNY